MKTARPLYTGIPHSMAMGHPRKRCGLGEGRSPELRQFLKELQAAVWLPTLQAGETTISSLKRNLNDSLRCPPYYSLNGVVEKHKFFILVKANFMLIS